MISLSSFDSDGLHRELDRVTLVMECTRRPVQLSEADSASLFAGTAATFWQWVVYHETGVTVEGRPSLDDPHWLQVRQTLAAIRGVPADAIEPTSALGI